ncbi:MAG: hypothetical protein DCC51_14395 [Anaerolineae bacterium]|nr:MAG: hypothetical protein DCC51_14395 [Anaerolineae bacterium]
MATDGLRGAGHVHDADRGRAGSPALTGDPAHRPGGGLGAGRVGTLRAGGVGVVQSSPRAAGGAGSAGHQRLLPDAGHPARLSAAARRCRHAG